MDYKVSLLTTPPLYSGSCDNGAKNYVFAKDDRGYFFKLYDSTLHLLGSDSTLHLPGASELTGLYHNSQSFLAVFFIDENFANAKYLVSLDMSGQIIGSKRIKYNAIAPPLAEADTVSNDGYFIVTGKNLDTVEKLDNKLNVIWAKLISPKAGLNKVGISNLSFMNGNLYFFANSLTGLGIKAENRFNQLECLDGSTGDIKYATAINPEDLNEGNPKVQVMPYGIGIDNLPSAPILEPAEDGGIYMFKVAQRLTGDQVGAVYSFSPDGKLGQPFYITPDQVMRGFSKSWAQKVNDDKIWEGPTISFSKTPEGWAIVKRIDGELCIIYLTGAFAVHSVVDVSHDNNIEYIYRPNVLSGDSSNMKRLAFFAKLPEGNMDVFVIPLDGRKQGFWVALTNDEIKTKNKSDFNDENAHFVIAAESAPNTVLVMKYTTASLQHKNRLTVALQHYTKE